MIGLGVVAKRFYFLKFVFPRGIKLSPPGMTCTSLMMLFFSPLLFPVTGEKMKLPTDWVPASWQQNGAPNLSTRAHVGVVHNVNLHLEVAPGRRQNMTNRETRCDLDISYPAFIFGNLCQSTDWPGWKSSTLVKYSPHTFFLFASDSVGKER